MRSKPLESALPRRPATGRAHTQRDTRRQHTFLGLWRLAWTRASICFRPWWSNTPSVVASTARAFVAAMPLDCSSQTSCGILPGVPRLSRERSWPGASRRASLQCPANRGWLNPSWGARSAVLLASNARARSRYLPGPRACGLSSAVRLRGLSIRVDTPQALARAHCESVATLITNRSIASPACAVLGQRASQSPGYIARIARITPGGTQSPLST